MTALPTRTREIYGSGDLNIVLARHRNEDRMVPLLAVTDTGGQPWVIELSSEDLMGLHKALSIIFYAILGHAISAAETNSSARAIVDEFQEKFGLLTTTHVLSLPNFPTAVDHSKVIEASASLREDVLRICEADLTDDVLDSNPESLTILHFAYYLDDDLWAQLGVFARQLLAESIVRKAKVEPYELAARFVRIRSTGSSRWPPEHYLNFFTKIVPIEHWGVDHLPHIEEDDISTGDMSLKNRAKFAAFVMKLVAAEQSPAATERSEEAQAAEANSAPEQISAEEDSPWTIEPIYGSANCNLRNRMATPKYAVRMEGEIVRHPDIGNIDGHAVVEVDTLRGVGGISRDVVISWHRREDRSDEQLRWRGELPHD
jgi:hypothetical protein